MVIKIIIAIVLIITFLSVQIIEEYKKLKEIEPMEKVLHTQALNKLDIAIIYKTLDAQIKLNNEMAKNKFEPKVKVEAIKLVNREMKNTLKKVKAIAKEAGVEI